MFITLWFCPSLEMSIDPASLAPVKLRANKAAASPAAATQPPLGQGPHCSSYPKRGAPPPPAPAALPPPGDANQTPTGYLEQLQHERCVCACVLTTLHLVARA